jgi:hypothetical protein
MKNSEQDPLARWTDQALRQLPQRPAPAGFQARVIAEIQRQAALPWYRRPWTQWNRNQRWFSFILFAALLSAVFGFVLPSLELAATQGSAGQIASDASRTLATLSSGAETVGKSLRLVIDRIPSLYLTAAFTALAALWLSTAGLGAACWRVATHSR